MTIAKFEAKHINGMALIETQCFTEPWTAEQLEEELYNPNAMFYVAEEDGEVIGYVGMHKIIDEGHITNLGVRRENRRKYVASALLERLFSDARALGVKSFTLEVRISNLAAIKLYTKFGFHPEGIRRKYYFDGEDAYILWKRK